jgi:hypothetical protein
LGNQLRKIPKIKKTQKMLKRANATRKKSISLSDNPAVRLVKQKGRKTMSVEVSLSAPNNDAIVRFSAQIGSPDNPLPELYEKHMREFYKLSVLHTKMSSSRRFGNGAEVPFNVLPITTQSKIIDTLAKELDLIQSDVALAVCSINPNLRIGYLPIASLREDCELASGDYSYQLVSSVKKDGYLAGIIQRHDVLKMPTVLYWILCSNLIFARLSMVIPESTKAEKITWLFAFLMSG